MADIKKMSKKQKILLIVVCAVCFAVLQVLLYWFMKLLL